MGVCVGRLDGWLFVDVNLGVQRWGYWCVCVCVLICISVCMCLRTCIYSSASERVRVYVCCLFVDLHVCVCVLLFCSGLLGDGTSWEG